MILVCTIVLGRHCFRLTYWGQATHICVSNLTFIGSDNGLSPGRRQAIIYTNAGILLIQTLGKYFSEILSEISTFSFKKMHWKMVAILSHPQCVKWLGTCATPSHHINQCWLSSFRETLFSLISLFVFLALLLRPWSRLRTETHHLRSNFVVFIWINSAFFSGERGEMHYIIGTEIINH